MDRAREGDLEALTPALTTNELGDLTVGFNDMLRGIAERERIKGLFGQYLTREISEAILAGRVNLNGARYEATVMFTDIRGFTAMSERLSPEEVFAFLNDYLGRMIEVITARGASSTSSSETASWRYSACRSRAPITRRRRCGPPSTCAPGSPNSTRSALSRVASRYGSA